MTELLTVKDLRVSFETPHRPLRAVDGVSLGLRSGETLALVGESGCGKSVTALSLLRLLPPAAHVAGTIRFDGRDILAMDEPELREVRGRQIAMVFQDPMSSLNPVRTIGIQMKEMLMVHLGMGHAAARARVIELLTLVGIPSPAAKLGAYPHQLSGGMRQRVMIAMALSCSPKLLVADEPTTALDVSIQAQILGLLRELVARLNTSMIIISHDLSVVAGLADRIAVMYAGEIVETGPTEQVFAHPRHPYTRGLLECIPRLDTQRTARLRSIEGGLPDPHEPKRGCAFAARCPFVIDRCHVEAPVLEPKAPGQEAACWVELSEPSRVPAFSASRAQAKPAALSDGHDSTPPLLAVKGLEVHFRLGGAWPLVGGRGRVRAVDGVSFDVRAGATLGVVGESGCGKSTTGRAILRLVRPTAGHVYFEGRDLVALDEEQVRGMRPRMQMVFQDPYGSLNPRSTVGDTVGEPLLVHRLARRELVAGRVRELLEMVGLRPRLASRYPHQLSGGQRQRVSIARALASTPSLVIADEPTSALDVSIRAQILNLMRDLQDEHRLTYLFISHDLSVIRHMSDSVAVMYLGKVVEICDRDELFGNPQHPYTRALLSVVPIPDPVVERRRDRSPIKGEVADPANPPRGCRFNTRCPLAFDRCFEEEPPLQDLGRGHRAACFLATPARMVLEVDEGKAC